jgi:hypothetical protein
MPIKFGVWLNSLSRRTLLLLLTGLFIGAHLLYLTAGVAFDASTLDWYWQFIDQRLLETRLLESVFYLHSQPPLYNLFLGLILKVSGNSAVTLFLWLHLLMGFALYLSLFYLLRIFSLARALSLILSTLFLVQPAFILYEMMLFYTLPQTLALTLSAIFLIRLWIREDMLSSSGLFICLLVLCGTWGIFHLAYFLLITGFLLYKNRKLRRVTLIGAILPLLLLTGIYVKNYLLFGKFTASTWLGMNVWYLPALNLSDEAKEQLIRTGKVSEISRIGPFAAVSSYPAKWREISGFEGVPVLREEKRANGNPSFHHLAYVGISDQFLSDSVAMTLAYPESYIKGTLGGWFLYFRSASDFHGVEQNRKRISDHNALFDRIVFLKTPDILAQGGKRYPVYISILLGLPLLFIYAIRLLFKKNANGYILNDNQRIALMFLCFHILFVAVVGNTLQSGENNRFRFTTDPFYLVLLGLFLNSSNIGRFCVRLHAFHSADNATDSSRVGH